jgi:hypothetical protein
MRGVCNDTMTWKGIPKQGTRNRKPSASSAYDAGPQTPEDGVSDRRNGADELDIDKQTDNWNDDGM